MADATLTYQTRFDRGNSKQSPVALTGLALIWSQDEPTRVGELLQIPPGNPGQSVVYGREALGQPAEAQRIRLTQQRPGRSEPLALTRSPRISRQQLKIHALGNGNLEVENLGRLPMYHNGTQVKRALVKVGDLIELKEQQVFYCVSTLSILPPLPLELGIPEHTFGQPDAQGIVGETAIVWEMRKNLHFASKASTHVLIQGASGVGKELVARGIHRLSTRRHNALLSRNAATFPEGLIDAELFGNAKGFPNPGMPDRPGLIGQAHDSSLFLDEFGELPSELQAHLLRVMDDGEYQRLGETTIRKANFRLIAATNRNTEQLKHDVAARLKLRLSIPDLNQRRADIPLIARHLLRQIAKEDGALANKFIERGMPKFTPALMGGLVRHIYTTHVRELEAFLWQSLAESQGDFLDLTPNIQLCFVDKQGEEAPPPLELSAITKAMLEESLTRHNGVQAKVWKELGLNNRFVLRRLLIKHNIDPQRFEMNQP